MKAISLVWCKENFFMIMYNLEPDYIGPNAPYSLLFFLQKI